MDKGLLEIDKILNKITNFSNNQHTIDNVINLQFSDDIDEINFNYDKVSEFILSLNSNVEFELEKLKDLRNHFEAIKINRILSSKELFEIATCIEILFNFNKKIILLHKQNISLELITNEIKVLKDLNFIFDEIKKCIDKHFILKDNASEKLNSIRKQLFNLNIEIREKMDVIKRNNRNKLVDDVVKVIDDKYVFLVKLEFKNNFDGIIHGYSKSGESVFIEPKEIYNLTANLNKVKYAEKEEETKILRELSNLCNSEFIELFQIYNKLIYLDELRIKAQYLKTNKYNRPILSKNNNINLKNTYHPLLNVEKIIKNNFNFNNKNGIIITGPNTGGKTITLKTVGIICFMVKLSLFIPADESSEVPIFSKIYSDIGDSQSIEENLSTFSSHMLNVINIVNNLNDNDLVLFDELGSGTEPNSGANIAKSIVLYLIKTNCKFIVTTHYPQMKILGYENDNVLNMSVEFDLDKLSPTFKLITGISGNSYAIDISRKLGLKDEILKTIDSFTPKQKDVNKLIEDLEFEVKNYHKIKTELDMSRIESENIIKKYNEKIQILNKKETMFLNEAKNKANEIIFDAKNKASALIDEIKKSKNYKIHEISDLKNKINKTSFIESIKDNPENESIIYESGDKIMLNSNSMMGTLKEKNNGKWELYIGKMRYFAKENEFNLVKKKVINNKKDYLKRESNKVISKSISNVLDLRGYRGIDVLDVLDKYIDDCILVKLNSCSIIHGYGTGVVKKIVRDRLSKEKNIKSFRKGEFSEGGDGVTVVYFL